MSYKVYDVFLSYSRADQRSVKRLAEKLRGADIDCFFDAWNISAGVPWQEALSDALKRSRSCAVVLGPKGPGSWTRMEIQRALDLHQKDETFRVIPILLPRAKADALPDFLSNFNWIDFRRGLTDAESFYRLICAIRREEPETWHELQTKDHVWSLLVKRAKAWEESGREEHRVLRGRELEEVIKWNFYNGYKITRSPRAFLAVCLEIRQRDAIEGAQKGAEALANPDLRLQERPQAHAYQSLTVLTRLAQRKPESTQALTKILQGRLDQLGEVAIDVAAEAGDPLGLILAERIIEEATPDILARLIKALEKHQDSVPLIEASKATTQKLLNIHVAMWPRPNDSQRVERAGLLEELGERLGKAGQPKEALPPSQEAVVLYRQLSSKQPATFSLDLARSLTKLGERLSELGRESDALAACKEAIAIARIHLRNTDD